MRGTKPKIPNFTLLEECGHGSIGSVWLAADSDGIRRAIRVMDLADSANKERIEAESHAIALYRSVANHHPNLLDILYVGRTAKYLYYVTDPADNAESSGCAYRADTLADRMARDPYSAAETQNYIEAILNGLEHLHKNNLAHRDLKPENILFIHNELKIADPGLTAPIAKTSESGTKDFLPHQRTDGEEADIYAVGKIIYCLYSRRNASCFPEIPMEIDISSIALWNEIALKCCGDGKASYHKVADIRADVKKIRKANRIFEILYRFRQNHHYFFPFYFF